MAIVVRTRQVQVSMGVFHYPMSNVGRSGRFAQVGILGAAPFLALGICFCGSEDNDLKSADPPAARGTAPTVNPQAEARNQAEMKRYSETLVGADVSFEMIPIPGGEFVMGSPEGEDGRGDDESPQHNVKIAPFW